MYIQERKKAHDPPTPPPPYTRTLAQRKIIIPKWGTNHK